MTSEILTRRGLPIGVINSMPDDPLLPAEFSWPRLRRGDLISLTVATAIALGACSTDVQPTQNYTTPDPQFPSTEVAPQPTAGPESLLSPTAEYSISPDFVRLSPVELSDDLNQYELGKIRSELQSGNTPLDLCQEEVGVQISCLKVPIANTPFELVGELEVKGLKEQKLGKIYYFTGENGLPYIGVERELDGNPAMSILTGSSDYKNQTGYDSWGFYTQNGTETTYFPVLVYDPQSGKLWYFNQQDKTIFEVEKPEAIGAGGVLALPVDVSKPVESAQFLMKDQPGWYLKYSTAGVLQILDLSGKVLYNQFDEKTGDWVKPSEQSENDIVPIYTQSFSEVVRGVNIYADLVTDKSLEPMVSKIQVQDSGKYADFVARTFFQVWWKNGLVKHTKQPNEDDYANFMTLWAIAQKSGLESDWKTVSYAIFSNDLNDGLGYSPELTTFWPMYDGMTPSGIVGIKKFTIVEARANKLTNVTMFKDDGFGQGYGTNHDYAGTLYVTVGAASGYYTRQSFASGIGWVPNWMASYNGLTDPVANSENIPLKNLLIRAGMTVTH